MLLETTGVSKITQVQITGYGAQAIKIDWSRWHRAVPCLYWHLQGLIFGPGSFVAGDTISKFPQVL